MFITWALLQNALELGLIYGLVALALFLSYSMLGCATCPPTAASPPWAVPWDRCWPSTATRFWPSFAAMGAGILSGLITALLQTKLGVESLLAWHHCQHRAVHH